ncbi:hypothetical protein P12x_001986 [Tundrisphaera lichenicola]|uniref:hypothetical protein n=1 Tax=Tundrisphaera lichenicola TaxID=2029860 RepID=UPI003EBD2CFC
MMNRRQLLARSTALMLAPGLARAADSPRKKVAFIGTEVRTHSHAQHFLDRMTLGYNWDGQWIAPRFDVASVYIDQAPEGDLAPGRIARHKLKRFPTVEEALTLGGSDLAVDGVVIIAEHGKYPKSELGQTLYPRYEFFKSAVKVFERSGRSVPIFNDKHLSTTWARCTEMVDDSKRLGFPFLAGSSLPVTWRLPQIDMPYDVPLIESVCVGYGGVDSYDFHGLETAQCMSERRKGGESGIVRVHTLKGPALWEAMATDDREVTRKLMVAALNRSHNLPVEDGYPSDAVTFEWARKNFPEMIAYFIDHADGFRTTLFLAAIRDFNYAGMRGDNGQVVSCQMYLPMPGQSATTADFFNPLTRHIEDLVLTGKANYPVERTLLTSGMVIGGVTSLRKGQIPVDTPEMSVVYKAPRDSQFRRS